MATRWPDAVIREYDPLLSGRLPEAFSGAGNDMILLGHPCGRGDVVDWVRQFRALPRFPPIVVVGSGDERQVVAAVKAGADDYVGKPGLSNARLVEAIEEALKSPRLAPVAGSGTADPSATGSRDPIPRNYEILRKLANGEIATVYLARQRNAERQLRRKHVGAEHDLGRLQSSQFLEVARQVSSLREDAAGVVDHETSSLARLERLGGCVHQLGADRRLEGANAIPERLLRQAECLGGAGQVAGGKQTDDVEQTWSFHHALRMLAES